MVKLYCMRSTPVTVQVRTKKSVCYTGEPNEIHVSSPRPSSPIGFSHHRRSFHVLYLLDRCRCQADISILLSWSSSASGTENDSSNRGLAELCRTRVRWHVPLPGTKYTCGQSIHIDVAVVLQIGSIQVARKPWNGLLRLRGIENDIVR